MDLAGGSDSVLGKFDCKVDSFRQNLFGVGAKLEFIVLALTALGIFFLPLILSVMAMASCQSLRKRVEKLEVSVKNLAASLRIGREDLPQGGGVAPSSGFNSVESFTETQAASQEKNTIANNGSQEVAQPVVSLTKEQLETIEPAAIQEKASVSGPKSGLWSGSQTAAVPTDAVTSTVKSDNKSENSLEQFFLGSLFSKLGALAIIVFIILFIKWLSPFLALTAAMKVGAVYCLSLILAVLGFHLLPKDNMRGISETLLGLGLASAIMITYAGSVYFDLWDSYISLVLASFILLGTYVLAYWAKRKAIICLGALAGYANLIFIQTSIDSTYVFDVYLVILALFCLIGTVRCQKWNSLFCANLAITWLFIITRTGIFEKADRIFSPYALGAIWLIVLAYDYFRRQEETDPKQPTVCINHLMMALGANCLYREGQAFMAFMMAAAALFCLAKMRAEKMNALARNFVNAGLFVTGLSAYSFQEPISRVVFLSAASLLILWIAFNKVPKLEVKRRLFFWSGLHNTLAFFLILAADFNGKLDFFLTPNRELSKLAILVFGISAISWLISYFMFRHYGIEEKYRDFNLWAGITLAYIYFGRELSDILDRVLSLGGRQWWSFSCFSLIAVCSIYALQAMLQAKKSKSNAFAFGFNAALVFSALGLIFNVLGGVFDGYGDFIPIVNVGFLAHSLTILALAAAFVLYGSTAYVVMAIFTGWLLIHTEGHNIVSICGIESITSVLWMLYAAAVIFVGVRFRKRYATNCGIAIVCITLLRVITYDIVSLPLGYKLLLFFVLGVALLITSYFYSKYAKTNLLAAEDNSESQPNLEPNEVTSSAVKSARDTQELKDIEIEIPDLENQNAFREVDSQASSSPFSDRLGTSNSVGVSAVKVVNAQLTNGEKNTKEGAEAPLAANKASWHND